MSKGKVKSKKMSEKRDEMIIVLKFSLVSRKESEK